MTPTDRILQAYAECALWSSTDDDGEPLDQSEAELAHETLATFRADVETFLADNTALIEAAQWATANDDAQLGHDLWLTRNRHGAGFWDGDWGEYGDTLTTAAHKMGECDLYVGDDGMIYAC